MPSDSTWRRGKSTVPVLCVCECVCGVSPGVYPRRFHLEELVLPWFNAPNEGIVTLAVALTLVGIFGSESRLIEITPGWSFARAGMWFFICSSFLTEAVQIVKVIGHESKHERAWSRAVGKSPFPNSCSVFPVMCCMTRVPVVLSQAEPNVVYCWQPVAVGARVARAVRLQPPIVPVSRWISHGGLCCKLACGFCEAVHPPVMVPAWNV
jgi:hypothetical protein